MSNTYSAHILYFLIDKPLFAILRNLICTACAVVHIVCHSFCLNTAVSVDRYFMLCKRTEW